MAKSPIRYSTLSSQILEIITDQIRNGVFPAEMPLPTESQLAAKYQVSRATIRSVFDRLDAMGLVVRRKGIGTFVRKSLSISNQLNQFIEFPKLIAENGFQPDFKQLGARIIKPTPEQGKLFKETNIKNILEIKKLFLADGDPIIYCINYIPGWVFSDVYSKQQVLEPGLTLPILGFLEEKCGQSINYFVSSVRADILGNCQIPDVFKNFNPQTPVLVIDEIGYNDNEQPVHQSIEYHPGNRMNFKLIRHRNR